MLDHFSKQIPAHTPLIRLILSYKKIHRPQYEPQFVLKHTVMELCKYVNLNNLLQISNKIPWEPNPFRVAIVYYMLTHPVADNPNAMALVVNDITAALFSQNNTLVMKMNTYMDFRSPPWHLIMAECANVELFKELYGHEEIKLNSKSHIVNNKFLSHCIYGGNIELFMYIFWIVDGEISPRSICAFSGDNYMFFVKGNGEQILTEIYKKCGFIPNNNIFVRSLLTSGSRAFISWYLKTIPGIDHCKIIKWLQEKQYPYEISTVPSNHGSQVVITMFNGTYKFEI